MKQVGGDHYEKHEIQPIEVIGEYLTEEEQMGYAWGNCIKYILRWKDKGGVEDLKKARWYLDYMIGER